jgi:DMSO/TMAO reductase YedYZ molybdopterin-dependent catalytic subunit
MAHSRSFIALCLILFSYSPAIHSQDKQATGTNSTAALSVSGEVERPLKLSAADLAKLPRRTVRAKDHSGKESAYEGVALIEILRLAGVPFGEGLRGKNLSLYLIVEAADGYRAVFALPELDSAFTDRIILLADHKDGNSLSTSEGPLRIVIPDEKRQARWVRQVTSLIIRRT